MQKATLSLYNYEFFYLQMYKYITCVLFWPLQIKLDSEDVLSSIPE